MAILPAWLRWSLSVFFAVFFLKKQATRIVFGTLLPELQ
jgi:hypothetical protein